MKLCHVYSVFTHIYSLLIEKDTWDCRNISIKLSCVYLCLSSEISSFFRQEFPLFNSIFALSLYFSFPCGHCNKINGHTGERCSTYPRKALRLHNKRNTAAFSLHNGFHQPLWLMLVMLLIFFYYQTFWCFAAISRPFSPTYFIISHF